jgi:hypothetical protein
MKNINEHDITKNMLETIREKTIHGYGNKKQLNEFIDGPSMDTNQDNTDAVTDTEDGVIELSGEERTSEETKFREIVDASTKFDVFNVYPQANNVVFGGKIQGMGGIEFQMTLEDTNGLYITGGNIQITDEVVEKIKKLKAFYDNFRVEWFQKLATEYNSSK